MKKALLKEIDTRAPKECSKEKIKKKTASIIEALDDLQYKLYASASHSILIILQGMDASGKDGVIKNVLGKLNPQGVKVQSFKAPTAEELSHDFLWRIHQHAPAKGMIQVFNRSHYEDVLVTRVHGWCSDQLAKERMKAINQFESLLQQHNNTTILKFYLHISPEEQAERLQERMENPAKQWKYNAKDAEEAKHWKDYMKVYEDVFRECNDVPWIITPADQNWYKEFVVAAALYKALRSLKLKYPSMK